MWKLRVMVLLLMVTSAGTLLADGPHYNNVLIGDRAAGMAGAYTAVADGPEGAWYNPAGLVFSDNLYFSLSTDVAGYKRTVYRDIQLADPSIIETTPDYSRQSLEFAPNFFGFAQDGRYVTFAFSIATTESESFDQRDVLTFELTEAARIATGAESLVANASYNQVKRRSEAGPSIAFLAADSLGIGFGLFMGYESVRYIQIDSMRFFTNEGQSELEEYFRTAYLYFSEQIISLRPQVGVQWMPTDTVSLGLALSSSLPVWGRMGNMETIFEYDNTNNDFDFDGSLFFPPEQLETRTVLSHGMIRPGHIGSSFGAAWFPSPAFLMSADFRAYVPLAAADGMKNEFTWNAAAGAEWYPEPNFPIRIGAYTNRSNRPELESGKVNQAERIDYYGGTFSFGFATAETTLNIGLNAAYGRGKAQILAWNTDIQTVDSFQLSVFLGGGYQF
ncbi:hypothetical protein [Spirochaeta dissipatitropha]